MGLLAVAVVGVALVVFVLTVAPKLGVASPLMLVALGIGVSLIPAVPDVHVEPHLVLSGILPPLLYSTAVRTPAMEFRRDLRTISFFAVPLVIASAVAVGFVLHWLIPDLPMGIAIAVGAVVSPTDAVATSIVKGTGASQRVISVLDGEAMLNDATALVLLRSAIATVAAGFAFWEIAWDFVWAVAVALVIGFVVGKLAIFVRARVPNLSANVAFSLTVPFLASIPAEHLGASGLVAAVVAGLLMGHAMPKTLSSEARKTSSAVWGTVNLLLESAIFLLMGLQLRAMIDDLRSSTDPLPSAVGMGALALLMVILIRAGFVAWALVYLSRRLKMLESQRDRFNQFRDRMKAAPGAPDLSEKWRQKVGDVRWERFKQILERRTADLDYLAAERMDVKDGVVLTAAGLRGAITVAAALTLPLATAHRSLLILIAYFVAAASLFLQGGTLAWLISALKITPKSLIDNDQLLAKLRSELGEVALTALDDHPWIHSDGTPYSEEAIEAAKATIDTHVLVAKDDPSIRIHQEERKLRLEIVEYEREELLRVRDRGTYPTEVLTKALERLDAEQMSIEAHYL